MKTLREMVASLNLRRDFKSQKHPPYHLSKEHIAAVKFRSRPTASFGAWHLGHCEPNPTPLNKLSVRVIPNR